MRERNRLSHFTVASEGFSFEGRYDFCQCDCWLLKQMRDTESQSSRREMNMEVAKILLAVRGFSAIMSALRRSYISVIFWTCSWISLSRAVLAYTGFASQPEHASPGRVIFVSGLQCPPDLVGAHTLTFDVTIVYVIDNLNEE